MNKQVMEVLSKGMVQFLYFFCFYLFIIFFGLPNFPCYYVDFIGLLSLLKSVSYNFHCLILCKQRSNIIITKILTAIMQYIFIPTKL